MSKVSPAKNAGINNKQQSKQGAQSGAASPVKLVKHTSFQDVQDTAPQDTQPDDTVTVEVTASSGSKTKKSARLSSPPPPVRSNDPEAGEEEYEEVFEEVEPSPLKQNHHNATDNSVIEESIDDNSSIATTNTTISPNKVKRTLNFNTPNSKSNKDDSPEEEIADESGPCVASPVRHIHCNDDDVSISEDLTNESPVRHNNKQHVQKTQSNNTKNHSKVSSSTSPAAAVQTGGANTKPRYLSPTHSYTQNLISSSDSHYSINSQHTNNTQHNHNNDTNSPQHSTVSNLTNHTTNNNNNNLTL